jgi:hypothetical protein
VATSSRAFRRGAGQLLALPGVVLLATAIGCQGRGDVSGKVTYNSKPLVFGTVLVHGQDGLRQGAIQRDGSFTVRGVKVGEARVAINSPNPKSIQLIPPKPVVKTKQEPFPEAPGWFRIPNKYEDVKTSGLTYTVRGGSNAFDIELK